jgi:opacity protein-like surface antigen
MSRTLYKIIITATVASCLCRQSAVAQQIPQAPQPAGSTSPPIFASTPGATLSSPSVALGPVLTSGLSLADVYDDNIYASPTNKVGDQIFLINPFANMRFSDANGQLDLGGNAGIGRYKTYFDENYNDYTIYARGRYNVLPILTLTAGASYAFLHEPRSSPDYQPGIVPISPITYNLTSVYGAALFKVDQNSFRVGWTYDNYYYNNSPLVGGGTLDNQDRNRDVMTLGARFGHWMDDNNELFGMFTYDNRHYFLPVDNYGFQKSSDGVRFDAGLHHRIDSTLDSEVYGGVIYQHYDDPLFAPILVPDFGGRVKWTGLANTTMVAELERTIQETDLGATSPYVWDVSGYVQTALNFDIVHWIRPNLRVNASASYYLDEFYGYSVSRTDQVQSYGLGVRDYLTPLFYVGADLTRTTRDSTDLSESYIDTRAMIRAGLVQEPAYKPADFQEPDVTKDFQGRFYAGVKGGVANVATMLQGSRGSGGNLQADFGDEGWAGGGLAGYGLYMGDWYLAVEGELDKTGGGWTHQHIPSNRIFSVSSDYSYGFSGTIGRSFNGGTMLYAKGGLVFTDFLTSYQFGSDSSQGSHTEPGLSVGFGASAPLTPELAIRLEHTYTSYRDYNINCCVKPAGGTPDNFSNYETMTSLGLVYTFGGDPHAIKSADVNYRGFYLGGQAGQDATSTWSNGPRESGTTLTATFGDLGYTAGLFGGYGIQANQFYLGGELEAELGKTNSDHESDPSGRHFAVEKQWDVGASVLGGYVVNRTALLYGRVGVAETRFQADYSTGDNAVSTPYTLAGLRFGGGVAFPVSNNVFVRADYTHTAYPGFNLVATPKDIENYQPKDDLFRVGLFYKFPSN